MGGNFGLEWRLTLRSRTSTAVFSFRQDVDDDDIYERLREAAASHLLRYREHQAGKGSIYIRIGDDIKIRLADHEAVDPPSWATDF